MNDRPEQGPPAADSAPADAAGAMPNRRGMLKGLGLGSPILLTLASAPVQAAAVCIMPSGYLSAATFNSRHPGGMVCTMQGPTFFKNNIGNATHWPTSGTNTQTTEFKNSSLFQSQADGGDSSNLNHTMAQVLSDSYASDFTKYCIAAYLNARTPPMMGWPAGLTTVRVIEIWRHFKAGGPLPGGVPAVWTLADAQLWLSTLMPV